MERFYLNSDMRDPSQDSRTPSIRFHSPALCERTPPRVEPTIETLMERLRAFRAAVDAMKSEWSVNTPRARLDALAWDWNAAERALADAARACGMPSDEGSPGEWAAELVASKKGAR